MPLKNKYRRRRTLAENQSAENGIETQEIKIIREDYINCGFCDGSGEYPPTFTCPACKGQGELRIRPPAVICAYCRGKGKQKPRSQLTCLACNGKGVVTIKEPVEICSKCRGRGKTAGNDTLLCVRCKGAGVVSIKDGGRRLIRKPGGSEGDVAEAIYHLGGEASVAEIAPRVRISTAYTEYVCKSMLDRGYLEKVSKTIYALTAGCEKVIAMKEDRDIERVSDGEREIIRIVRDEGEVSTKEIAQRSEINDFKIVKRVCLKLAKQDMLDLLTSGKLVLSAKGEKILQSEKQYNWR
jgi:Mn-dependent DtxR family transcriptional regulator